MDKAQVKASDLTQENTTPANKLQRQNIRVLVPLDSQTHHEISTALNERSLETGFEITVPKFLRKTVAENWRVQLERYRRVDAALHKPRL